MLVFKSRYLKKAKPESEVVNRLRFENRRPYGEHTCLECREKFDARSSGADDNLNFCTGGCQDTFEMRHPQEAPPTETPTPAPEPTEKADVAGFVKEFLTECTDTGFCYSWNRAGDEIGLKLAHSGPDALLVNQIWTPPEFRGKGHATNLMRWLCELADKYHVKLVLFANNFGHDKEPGSLNNRQLFKFYSQFGFKSRSPESRQVQSKNHMIRTPGGL